MSASHPKRTIGFLAIVPVNHEQVRAEGGQGRALRALYVAALRNAGVLRLPIGAIEHIEPHLIAATSAIGHIEKVVVDRERRTATGLRVAALCDFDVVRQPGGAIEDVVPEIIAATSAVG